MIGYPQYFLLSAAFDYAGIGSLVAGVTAVVALWFSHKNNKRAAQNTETVSYVDNNLKVMQGTLDWLTKDNQQLREVNAELRLVDEQRRLELVEMHEEVEEMKAELIRCRETCERLTRRFDDQQNGLADESR